MTTHELLREGEWTVDGRLLALNTTSWPVQVPVLAHGVGTTVHVVGALDNIRREGNKIFGDTDVTIGTHMALTCRVDHGTARELAPGRIEMSDVVLVAVYVNEKDNYPWKNEEEGGEAG